MRIHENRQACRIGVDAARRTEVVKKSLLMFVKKLRSRPISSPRAGRGCALISRIGEEEIFTLFRSWFAGAGAGVETWCCARRSVAVGLAGWLAAKASEQHGTFCFECCAAMLNRGALCSVHRPNNVSLDKTVAAAPAACDGSSSAGLSRRRVDAHPTRNAQQEMSLRLFRGYFKVHCGVYRRNSSRVIFSLIEDANVFSRPAAGPRTSPHQQKPRSRPV